ncbi:MULTISPECIES: sensor histidine kinase [Henriciella]|jgi:two-component system phosphate regulon sensor histidine kinase PhoR|uniref:sensor histidine kinase n=1 Tax=Henriciella TaxID=453849 RepID=UPI0035195A4B
MSSIDRTPEPASRRPERARDFLVLTFSGCALIALLIASGALGWIEGLTACMVLSAGALAYFVGSVPPERIQDDAANPASTAASSEGSVRTMIESLPFPAFHITPDNRIDALNEPVRPLFRVSQARGALKSVAIRQPDLLSATDRVARTGASERVEFMAGEGDELWLAHLTAGVTPQSVFVFLEDRTAVHRAERARADFLANASHELRTPLTALAGFIETMRGPAKNDRDSWDGFLEIMHQQTDRMRHLVSDLLSLSRIEFSEHRPPDSVIDLSEVLGQTILALEPIAAERSITLSLDGGDAPVKITAKWDEIAQVVQNLVGNALKYSPSGGSVRVTTGVTKTMLDAGRKAISASPEAVRATLLQPRASAEAPAAWIRVEDDGQGIARKHLGRLGERFYRADESRGGSIEGTGLGLAIVKHIMARHRGGLGVASKEGDGAAFGVWLPIAESAAHTAPEG